MTILWSCPETLKFSSLQWTWRKFYKRTFTYLFWNFWFFSFSSRIFVTLSFPKYFPQKAWHNHFERFIKNLVKVYEVKHLAIVFVASFIFGKKFQTESQDWFLIINERLRVFGRRLATLTTAKAHHRWRSLYGHWSWCLSSTLMREVLSFDFGIHISHLLVHDIPMSLCSIPCTCSSYLVHLIFSIFRWKILYFGY